MIKPSTHIRSARMFVAFFCLLLCSCSQHQEQYLEYQPEDAWEIDLFATRGSLGAREYERYHIQHALLYQECGSIHDAADFDENEEDESLRLESSVLLRTHKDVSTLDTAALAKLQHLAEELATRIEQDESPIRSIDKDFVEIRMKKAKEHTSMLTLADFDDVSDGANPKLQASLKLYRTLRGLDTSGCGAGSFFGVTALK